MKNKTSRLIPVLAIFHALVTSLFISISAPVSANDLNVDQVIRNPLLGVENSVYVGDTIYEQTVGEVVRCLVPLVEKREKRSFGLHVAILRKSVPICEGDKKNEFIAPYKNYIENNRDMGLSYPLKLKQKKNGDIKLGFMGFTLFKLSEEEVRIEELPRPDSEIKKLELLGVSEDELQILYVESSVGEIGDVRERDFSVDLTKKSSIYWRGLEIEVVSAGRGELTYKVLNGFK